jgi:ubiquinone/menaquinone biosynthesis C-methylase UbiE
MPKAPRAASQAMLPNGLMGRLFAPVMEWINTSAYQRAVEALSLRPGDRLLEIGFGTGALLELAASRVTGGVLAGIDASLLMHAQAASRLRPYEPGVKLDLRVGTDDNLNWPECYFDCVVAVHSFQFWTDPNATLRTILGLLKPSGQLLLILRSHSHRVPSWLPNPISRSGDEVGGVMTALARAGFERLTRHADVRSSAVLSALRKAQ